MKEMSEGSTSFKIFTFPIEEFLDNFNIKALRFSTCDIIFKEIVKNYCASLPLMYLNEGDSWVFREGEHMEKVWIEGNKLTCSCKYREKSGIPCCHLHKIIDISRDNVHDYIHNRWKMTIKTDEQKPNKIQVSKGRPKNSRKNIM